MKPDGVGQSTTTTQNTHGKGKALGQVNKGHKGYESDTNPAGKTKGEGFAAHNKHFISFKAANDAAAVTPATTIAEAPTPATGLNVEA